MAAENRVAGKARGWRAAAPWLALAALAVATAAVRWDGLGRQSLWLDEGVSVYFAGLGPGEIVAATFSKEPNPPLYYLALWAWLAGWGTSEAAVRGLSALAGVLCLFPTYALARSLAGPRAGLLAALAAAASPYLVWYSQEARAFALLAFLAATLLHLTWRTTVRPTRLALALWALAAILVLYTHLYGLFTVAACAAFLLCHPRSRSRAAALAVAATALAYLPWFVSLIAHNDPAQNWRAPVAAGELLARSLAAAVHYGVLAEPEALVVGGLFLGLALLGAASHRYAAGALLGLTALAPPAGGYLLSLLQPAFGERYIIAAAIPFYVAAALGVERLAPRLRGLPALAAVGLLALGWSGLQAFQTERYAKEDFRAAAALVAQAATAEDVVLFVADYARHPFAYYYDGPARLVGFAGDPQAPGPFLDPLLAGTRRLWLIESHAEWADPEHRVRQWLAERFPLATEAFPRAIHMRAFSVRYQVAAPPATARRVDARFGPLRLAAVELPPSTPAQDTLYHPPSAWLPVTLYWCADGKPETDYRLLLQLVDSRGVWGGLLPREGDLLSKVPTSRWRVGETLLQAVDVNLNPATPPGRYQLQLSLLRANGEPEAGYDEQGKPLPGPLLLGEVAVR